MNYFIFYWNRNFTIHNIHLPMYGVLYARFLRYRLLDKAYLGYHKGLLSPRRRLGDRVYPSPHKMLCRLKNLGYL